MKKILLISSSYPFGKQETFLENEIDYLANFFEIHVLPIYKFNKSDKPRSVPANVTYSRPVLKKNHFKRFLRGVFNTAPVYEFIYELFNILKNPDHVVHHITRWYLNFVKFRTLLSHKEFQDYLNEKDIWAVYFYWGGAPAKFLNISKPVFIRVHGSGVYKQKNRDYLYFKEIRFISSNNIIYLPISRITKDILRNINANANTIINRLGVYDHGSNPSEKKDFIRIVSCSNLIPLKRVHLIVEALSKIGSQKVIWVHFGDGVLMDELMEQTKKLDDNIQVHFKGRVPNEEILTFYHKVPVDLFINVSETEGVPVSIMEALSFGIPCFATDVGGTNELVDDSVGKLVPKDFDITQLSYFINNLKYTNNKQELRNNCKTRWREMANANENYKELAQMINGESTISDGI
jgi:glycosyltransferase involved in cell wall biosynthesis